MKRILYVRFVFESRTNILSRASTSSKELVFAISSYTHCIWATNNIKQIKLRDDKRNIREFLFFFLGPMLTNEQIQGITILTGSISVVFVFLITILFVVFCYYKKKRDEWHYKSYGTTGDVSRYNPDFKSIAASMRYSSANQNASPSSYGATLTPNQYLLSKFNDSFNPNMECSPFHTAVNFSAEQQRLKGTDDILLTHFILYSTTNAYNTRYNLSLNLIPYSINKFCNSLYSHLGQ